MLPARKRGIIEQITNQVEISSDRPRKVYQLTKEGGLLWKKATLQALYRPNTTYTNSLMGLHTLWNIPPADALETTLTYRGWLEKDLQRQQDKLEGPGMTFFTLDVLLEYSFMLVDAELSFLTDLITLLKELSSESD